MNIAERINPGLRLAHDLEAQFGVNLTQQISGLRVSREARHFAIALERIQFFLQAAGIELTRDQRRILEDILRDNLR